MKIVNDILSDLVEKKLWPVAAVLVVLLVGVPMQLSKPGDPPVVPAVPSAAAQNDVGPQLALTRATRTGFERAPRVNKSAMDPFGERNSRQSDAALKALKKSIMSALSSTLGGGGAGGGASTGGSDGGLPVTSDPKPEKTPSDKPEKTTPVEEETDDLLSLLVTVGDGQPTPMNEIRTLSPLPDATNPFLVYTGKTEAGAAVFIVSADVQPSGEGTCEPSPDDCRTLTLAEGQTEDFKLTTSGGGTVSITMVGIDTGKVKTTGTAARAARLELKARRVGAGVVRDALDDPSILRSLARHKVRLRG